MLLLGIDLGTTKVASVLIDSERNEVVSSASRNHRAELAARSPWEHIQDPDAILTVARELLADAVDEVRPRSIGGLSITGQMHGILYVDGEGKAVSPLFTWLDRRGAEPFPEGASYTEALSRETGYHLSSGFGTVTHFYNQRTGRVPKTARFVATILDYATMRLTGRRAPVSDETTAASIGLFDIAAHCFDAAATERAGFFELRLPSVAVAGERIGTSEQGIAVFAPVADNQASFIGSVADPLASLLVNVGTGGQLSRYAEAATVPDGSIEVRPFPGRGFLQVGAALCSGKAYELLRDFFADVVVAFGGDPERVDYDTMNLVAAAAGAAQGEPLRVDTRFAGTRTNGGVRGAISGISLENLSAANLSRGVLDGIAAELYDFSLAMGTPGDRGGRAPAELRLIGAGNALRRNAALRSALEHRFGRKIGFPALREEAALGAALCAGVGAGAFEDYLSAGRLIRYLE